MTKNIMIVGVGGQGTLLASKILGHVLLSQNFDVKVSEVHGMSQRGGSVVTYVRYGEKVYSPVIDKGEADAIVAFEKLEAARWISYLKKGGQIIVNTQEVEPMPVITGAAEYPQELVSRWRQPVRMSMRRISSRSQRRRVLQAVNIALMGRLSKYFSEIPAHAWEEAIDAIVAEKFRALNHKAFELGRNA